MSIAAPTPIAGGIREIFLAVTGRNYGYTSVPEATIAALPQTYYTPYGNSGPISKDTTGTGGHYELGLVDGFSSIALIQNDARLGIYADVISEAASSMPTNWVDGTGNPPLFSQSTGKGTAYGNYSGLTQTPNNNGYGWNLDIQHQCHYHWLAFLDAYRRQDAVRMDVLILRMKQLVTDTYLRMPACRFGAMNIYNPGQLDMRGAAWGFMSLGWALAAMQLRGLNASNDYNFAEFVYSVQQNATFLVQQYIAGEPTWDNSSATPYYDYPNGIWKNSLGFVGAFNNYPTNSVTAKGSGFQFCFLAQTLQTIYGMAKRGFLPINATSVENLRKIAVHVSKLVVALGGPALTAGKIDFRRGMHMYEMPVGTPLAGNASLIGAYYTSYSQIMDSWVADFGAMPAMTTPPIIYYHGSFNPVGTIGDGYVSNYMPALAGAYDLQSEGENLGDDAYAAWARLESSDVWINSKTSTSGSFAYTPRARYLDAAPGPAPSPPPTVAPTPPPVTVAPTAAPTVAPTTGPTSAPTPTPTQPPTAAPTSAPTSAPTAAPTSAPGAPVVSAVSAVPGDVDPATPGVQEYAGTTVVYPATATDPGGLALTWQWFYTISGGSRIAMGSGAGASALQSFTYSLGAAGIVYNWIVRFTNSGGQFTESSLNVAIIAPTTAPTVAPTLASTLAPTSAPTVPGGTSGTPGATTGGYPWMMLDTTLGAPWLGLDGNPIPPALGVPALNTILRSKYGATLSMTGGAAQLNSLPANGIAYIGRILNASNELDFAVQVKTVAMTPNPMSLEVLSIYVGAGVDAAHMPQYDDTDNLVKVGEVGLMGMGGWSSLTSIAKSLNFVSPCLDIYVKNDAGVTLPAAGHDAVVLPASAAWVRV